ncbi:hypothetical protein BGX30_001763, partial [Mortierella sp. GBA39]
SPTGKRQPHPTGGYSSSADSNLEWDESAFLASALGDDDMEVDGIPSSSDVANLEKNIADETLNTD